MLNSIMHSSAGEGLEKDFTDVCLSLCFFEA
jgi:hypothetical protein